MRGKVAVFRYGSGARRTRLWFIIIALILLNLLVRWALLSQFRHASRALVGTWVADSSDINDRFVFMPNGILMTSEIVTYMSPDGYLVRTPPHALKLKWEGVGDTLIVKPMLGIRMEDFGQTVKWSVSNRGRVLTLTGGRHSIQFHRTDDPLPNGD